MTLATLLLVVHAVSRDDNVKGAVILNKLLKAVFPVQPKHLSHRARTLVRSDVGSGNLKHARLKVGQLDRRSTEPSTEQSWQSGTAAELENANPSDDGRVLRAKLADSEG